MLSTAEEKRFEVHDNEILILDWTVLQALKGLKSLIYLLTPWN